MLPQKRSRSQPGMVVVRLHLPSEREECLDPSHARTWGPADMLRLPSQQRKKMAPHLILRTCSAILCKRRGSHPEPTTRRARLPSPTNSRCLRSLRRLAPGKITSSVSATPIERSQWREPTSCPLPAATRRTMANRPTHGHRWGSAWGGPNHGPSHLWSPIPLPPHTRAECESPPPQCPHSGARSTVVAERND